MTIKIGDVVMAFDLKKAMSKTMKRQNPPTKKSTFESAKEDSWKQAVGKQINNFNDGDRGMMGKNGKPKPSNWMRKDADGNWFISWRISNKPVFLHPDLGGDNKGWMYSDNVVADLKALAEEIKSDKWDKELREAYDRPAPEKKKKKKTETEEA